HDLFLRLARNQEFKPHHIPLFCYYWRLAENSTARDLDTKPYIVERGARLLDEHLEAGKTRWHTPYSFGRNRFPAIRHTAPEAKLLVIVPYKDSADMTISCLES